MWALERLKRFELARDSEPENRPILGLGSLSLILIAIKLDWSAETFQ